MDFINIHTSERITERPEGNLIIYGNKLRIQLNEELGIEFKDIKDEEQGLSNKYIRLQNHDANNCKRLASLAQQHGKKSKNILENRHVEGFFIILGNSTLYKCLHDPEELSHPIEGITELIPYVTNEQYKTEAQKLVGCGWTTGTMEEIINEHQDNPTLSNNDLLGKLQQNATEFWQRKINPLLEKIGSGKQEMSLKRTLAYFVPRPKSILKTPVEIPDLRSNRIFREITTDLDHRDVWLLLEGLLIPTYLRDKNQWIYHLPSLPLAHQAALHVPNARFYNASTLIQFTKDYNVKSFPF